MLTWVAVAPLTASVRHLAGRDDKDRKGALVSHANPSLRTSLLYRCDNTLFLQSTSLIQNQDRGLDSAISRPRISNHIIMTATDPEIATKAPESDAQEDAPTEPAPTASVNVEDATASPKLGEHCVSDRPVRMLFLVSLV